MAEETSRPIHTVYYRGREVVRTNCSRWANNAVPLAVKHMQTNEYDATHCEVYDTTSGELHAVIRRKRGSGHGEIDILFKRDVKEGM